MNSLVKEIKDIGRGIQVGVCSTCSERVVMGRFSNVFQHEIILSQKFHDNGSLLSQSSKRVDYCPQA